MNFYLNFKISDGEKQLSRLDNPIQILKYDLNINTRNLDSSEYRKATEPSNHSSLLSGIYPFLAMHSLLVTRYEYFVRYSDYDCMKSIKGHYTRKSPLTF